MSGWRRAASLAVAGALAFLPVGVPALADEPGESAVASELVRQAIALAANTPGNRAAIADKLADALGARDGSGVDLALVRQAQDTLAAPDLHQLRLLLEASIGAQPHLGGRDVAPIREIAPQRPATGAEPGVAPILDPLEPSGVGSPGDWVVLAAALTLVGLGLFLAARWRPAPRAAV